VGEVVLLVLVEGEVVAEGVEMLHQVQVVVEEEEEEGVLVQMMVEEGVVLHLSFVLPLL